MDNIKLYYFLAVKEILETFAEMELGSGCEIDVDSVAQYMESMKFITDVSYGLKTKEEIYQKVTDDILNGYPVWQLLDCPAWTKKILEREFAAKQERHLGELKKKYKCYTCKYYHETNTPLGILPKCIWKPSIIGNQHRVSDWKTSRKPFKPKKSCKNYERE